MKTDIKLQLGDCLELMKGLEDNSIDLICCDLPYGSTACKWDSVIPFQKLWTEYKRICKDNSAIVLFGSQPFTSLLTVSNLKDYKYTWVWDKVNRVSGYLNAKKQPMRIVEDIVVFYKSQTTYNPQMTNGKPYTAKSTGRKSDNYGSQIDNVVTVNNGEYYPRNLLSIKADERGTVGRLHPTQKPVALMEYLIKTYTTEGMTVLDNCMGSGTTGVACINTNRKFIGMEKDENYFSIAKERIESALAARDEIAKIDYEKV